MKLEKNDIILFIGDSITDADRNREDGKDLGDGYPKLVAQALEDKIELTILNRGIGGDKVSDLEKRWQEDCLDLNPTVLSIMIGINDTWHATGSSSFGSKKELKEFEASYRRILTQAKEKTNAKIIILEPFVLSYPEDRLEWRKDLDPRIQVVRRLAEEFSDEYVPLDGILNAAGMKHGYQSLTGDDGVHPTPTGHELIAKAWLDVIEI